MQISAQHDRYALSHFTVFNYDEVNKYPKNASYGLNILFATVYTGNERKWGMVDKLYICDCLKIETAVRFGLCARRITQYPVSVAV